MKRAESHEILVLAVSVSVFAGLVCLAFLFVYVVVPFSGLPLVAVLIFVGAIFVLVRILG